MGALLFEAMGDPALWNFKGFVDSKIPGEALGFPVWSFEQFRGLYRRGDQVVITSNYVDEIAELLSQIDVLEAYDANVWYHAPQRSSIAGEFKTLTALLAADRAVERAATAFVGRLGTFSVAMRRGLAELMITQGVDFHRACIVGKILEEAATIVDMDLPVLALVRSLLSGGSPEELYRVALRLDPTSGRAHFCLARLLEGRSDVEEALEHYFDVVKLDDDLRPHAALHIAQILQKRKEKAQALSYYREALSGSSYFGEYAIPIANALREAGEYITALEQFSESLRHERYCPPEFAVVNRPIAQTEWDAPAEI